MIGPKSPRQLKLSSAHAKCEHVRSEAWVVTSECIHHLVNETSSLCDVPDSQNTDLLDPLYLEYRTLFFWLESNFGLGVPKEHGTGIFCLLFWVVDRNYLKLNLNKWDYSISITGTLKFGSNFGKGCRLHTISRLAILPCVQHLCRNGMYNSQQFI